MGERLEALEACVAELEVAVKLLLVEFYRSLLLEITKLLKRCSSDEGHNGEGGTSFSTGDSLSEYRMAAKKVELPLFDGTNPVGVQVAYIRAIMDIYDVAKISVPTHGGP